MGGNSSKNKNKHVNVSKKSRKSNKQHSSHDSDLDDDDLTLVTVPLDGTITDKRLSKARELIRSGRPISISLEATTEDEKNTNIPTWGDDTARERWKGQLDLMRHFYDWEEIPLDFFVDTYVGGSGEALRHRRLSLNLVTEPEPVRKPQYDPLTEQERQHLPHNRTITATTATTRVRASSVAVPDHSSNLPLAMAELASPRAAKNTPKTISPAVIIAQNPPPLPPRKPVVNVVVNEETRARAASVAIGENFPLPIAAAIQKHHPSTIPAICNPQTPRAEGETFSKNKNDLYIPPSDEEVKRMSLAASKSKKSPIEIAKENEVSSRERSSSRVNRLVEEETRPRRASATSIDQVYGRLGKPGGAYDRFEMENPILSQQQKSGTTTNRSTVSDKKPEQFKNMTATIDPTQFANERKNTRHSQTSKRTSAIDKPMFDEGRVSTTSTMLESKSSNENSRSRTMSDWL